MKIKMRIISFLAVALLIVPAFGYSMTVSFFLGKVKLIRAGKTTNLKRGDNVGNGDIIKTGKGAIVDLRYSDKSKVSIKPNTIVKIGSSHVKDSEGVSIVSGQISGKFVKLKKGKHKLYTPTTVAGVRGTKFKIAVSKGGDSKIDLSQGRLEINNAYGKVDLKRGYSVQADVAGKPKKGRLRGSINRWQKSKNKYVSKNIDKQADKYERQMSKWEKDSENANDSLDDIEGGVEKIKNDEDLKNSGKAISQAEDSIENNMMMNEASKINVKNLSEDFEGKEVSDRFEDIAEKSDSVREQQQKNYEALQKIKADYKEARDKILNKYKDDKTNIKKGFDDFKKNLFKKKAE